MDLVVRNEFEYDGNVSTYLDIEFVKTLYAESQFAGERIYNVQRDGKARRYRKPCGGHTLTATEQAAVIAALYSFTLR